jgi:hypothetical protein
VFHVLFMLFVFIYVNWHQTRFPCPMMFASSNSNTTMSHVEQELRTLPGNLSRLKFTLYLTISLIGRSNMNEMLSNMTSEDVSV